MFDIGATELLLIVVIAIVVIGPKDLPRALRTAGRWMGKLRRMSGHVRTGIDAMIREAELEDLEKEWKDRNARIMAEHPAPEGQAEASAEARTSPESAEYSSLPDAPSPDVPSPDALSDDARNGPPPPP